ncbi:hypothetical protein J4Q44_G00132790 [Coregonus suidteri]|uniref:Sulfate transporter n=1 Tax=Coregonus suidteri TaxID=861788 RepID=A0AAN8QTC1_9TELE
MEEAKVTEVPHLERRVRQRKEPMTVLKTKLSRSLSCSVPRVKNTLTGFFPVVLWLPKYKLKEYIWGDLMSGLIIGIILVPQAIAYCLLAGVDPIYGLYTSFFANIIYFFMGTSRHVSVGIFSLMSLMVGQVVDREVYMAGFELDDTKAATVDGILNVTGDSDSSAINLKMGAFGMECGKECYAISIAAALTFLAGIYQVLMAVFRLGFVSVYLSAPMLDGFATGASLTILTVQAKYLLGLKIPRHQGYGTVVVTWINIFRNIQNTNYCDLITSIICISVLVLGKELQDRYKDRLKIPLPTELVVVAGATLASHFGDFHGRYDSGVSGAIPTGFIPPKVPSFGLMPQVAFDAIPLAVISFAFTVSLSEMFAKKNGYTVRPNQEMMAIGFCNIIPSFFHCFTVSPPALPWLRLCLRGALRKFRDVPSKWRVSKMDAIVWMVTMSASALISVEMGLVVGVVFSILCVIVQTQKPKVSLLGQIHDTVHYEDMEEYENLMSLPKVKIFRFQAPLYYANKDFFLKSLYKAVGVEPFLEMTRRREAEKKAEKMAAKEARRADKTNGEVNVGLVSRELDFHTIILDCSAMPFVDSTGMQTFKGIIKDYKELGVTVLLASCNTTVIDSLRQGSFFGKADKDMESLSFYTVHAAVQFANERVTSRSIGDSVV